uniref:ATP synthase complex subunit 8 n=1 Tax=Bifidoprionus rufus TaxID=2546597 RepID=A0A6H0N3C8_9CUCU|nr:ATP synthase F0 subunit 8 [Bifidoprionus rufus]
MPQMAPLNWLILMIFFVATFFIFNILNFFSFKYLVKKSSGSKVKHSINWKW